MGQTTSTESTRLAVRMGGPEGGVVISTSLRVIPVALVLAAVHALVSLWRLSRSWYWQDDLNLLALVGERPLPELLFSDYNGHLVPGSWLAAWVSNQVAPLEWWPAATAIMVFIVGTDLALLAALRRLFGERPAILIPYAVFCASTLTLTSSVWWAAALQWWPTTLALALALFFHAGYVEKRNIRDFAGAVGSLALGLFFFEKALVIPVVLALLTIAYFVPGRLWMRPVRAFTRYFLYWLALGAVAGGYVWLYLTRATVEPAQAVTTGNVFRLMHYMLLDTFLPSLAGGPLAWYSSPANTLSSWPHPPPWLSITVWTLTAVVVLASLVLVRGAWRAWAVLLIFLAISVALVARARLGLVGPFIGRDHRYLTDATLLASLCLALAWIPLRPGLDRVVPRSEIGVGSPIAIGPVDGGIKRPRRIRRWRRQAMDGTRAWHDGHRATTMIAGGAAIAVVTIGGMLSGERFMNVWETNPGKEFFTTLQAGLYNARPKPVFMFDQELPPLIMAPTFGEERMLSHVTKPLGDDAPRFGTVGPRFWMVDGRGKMYAGEVMGATVVPPGNGLVCSNAASPAAGVALALPGRTLEWDWKVEISYSANQDTTAQVQYGAGPKVDVRLAKGLGKVVVAAHGAGPDVRLSALRPGAVVCLSKVTVGNAVPGVAVTRTPTRDNPAGEDPAS